MPTGFIFIYLWIPTERVIYLENERDIEYTYNYIYTSVSAAQIQLSVYQWYVFRYDRAE